MLESALNITHPNLAAEWHPTKNGDLMPENIQATSIQKVWWLLSYSHPKTGKQFDFEWQATVCSRAAGNGCPYIAKKNAKAWPGFNDLSTKKPRLAAEWHPTKNGDLTPDQVTVKSNKKVWWLLSYDDPETGKHFDFEWKATVKSRAEGADCPYLSGRKLYRGFNDLATKRPDLAAEWHPTKNGDLSPEQVTTGSGRKVWWLLPYDDPKTGKHFDFEWEAVIANRTSGNGCPYFSGNIIFPGFNDLATTHPNLAAEWHPTKNRDLTPDQVTAGSSKKVWWYLPYDDTKTGKHFDFEWETTVINRTNGSGCPYLSGYAVWPGFNDLATLRPDLAAEWHPTKNNGLTPDKIIRGSAKVVWWKDCSGCEWRESILGRVRKAR